MKVAISQTRLRVLRAERHISQMEVAAGTGISHNRYWRIENGYADATDEEREVMARFFGVRQRDLIRGAA